MLLFVCIAAAGATYSKRADKMALHGVVAAAATAFCKTKLTHHRHGVWLSKQFEMINEHCAKIHGKGDILRSGCNQPCDLSGLAHYLLHLSMIS